MNKKLLEAFDILIKNFENMSPEELEKEIKNHKYTRYKKILERASKCDNLYLSKNEAKSLLEGLKADAYTKIKNGRLPQITYGTISYELAIQIRVLYKILGIDVYISKCVNHGGFGKNPIYRIYVRNTDKSVKIKSIKYFGKEQVYDIQTGNNGIYLPEGDIEVHNCEDFTILFMDLVNRLYKIKPSFYILKRYNQKTKEFDYHAVCEIDGIIYDPTANKKFYLANSEWIYVSCYSWFTFNFCYIVYKITYFWNKYILRKKSVINRPT